MVVNFGLQAIVNVYFIVIFVYGYDSFVFFRLPEGLKLSQQAWAVQYSCI